MKAQNLTIGIPYNGCDKNCPYCISKITNSVTTNTNLMLRNLPKVHRIIDSADVINILLTGKGEPFKNYDWIIQFCKAFHNFPLEVQTNGIWLNSLTLSSCENVLMELYNAGLNTIAISIDLINDLWKYAPLFDQISQQNILVRICINVTNMINIGFRDIFRQVLSVGNINQLLFRNITVPRYVKKENKATRWIEKNVDEAMYHNIVDEFMNYENYGDPPIRILPFGMPIYSCKGISIAFSDYCIQDSHGVDDLRSLIFQEDGHVYTHWADSGSILF